MHTPNRPPPSGPALPLAGAALVVFALAAAACGSTQRQLRIVGTTDVHGYFASPGVRDREPLPGGLRQLGAVVDELREDADVLLLDSGDMWSGTLLSDRNEGALGVTAYNQLRYDAAALGNHEFDYGPVGPSRVSDADPFGALKANLMNARFAVLAANLVDRETGIRPTWPGLSASAVVKRGGLEIGIIGVITPTTPSITFPYVGERLAFTDPVTAIVAEATRLRATPVDLIVVVAHIGGRCRDFANPEDLTSCDQDSELFDVARRLPAGLVDVIFGGHTHAQLAHRVNGIALLQAGRYGRHVSVVEVDVSEGGRPALKILPPRPVMADPTSRTARMMHTLLSEAEESVESLRAEALGARIVQALTRRRDEGSPMGAFLCDAMLGEYRDREICIINSGGIRNDLPPGPVSYGKLYDAMPFGNAPAHLDVSGRVLRELIRRGTTGGHGVIQVAGLRVTYDRGKDPCPGSDRDGSGIIDGDDRDRLLEVTLADGKPLEDERIYRVVTNSFLAAGGDGWRSALAEVHPDRIKVLYEDLAVREIVAKVLRRDRPVLNSPDDPIRFERRVIAVGAESTNRCPPRPAPAS